MVKAHWHTWTLFIQGGKYKWSQKYDYCQSCGRCDFKHKWNGICTSCTDKIRAKNPERKKVLKKSNSKWIAKKPEVFLEYQKEWHAEYNTKNKEVINLLRKWERHRKSWKPILQIERKAIPFMEIVKPNVLSDREYKQWKENNRIFTEVKLFLEKTQS